MKKDILNMPGMMAVCAILLVTCIALLVLSMPAEAAERCIRLSRVSGFETLVNTCNSCRNTRIIRDRTGVALPTNRSYQIDGLGRQDLYFKGPGRTRIISDESCGLEAGVDQVEKKKAEDYARRCVVPVQTDRGMIMVNGCTSCRKIVVERSFPDGYKELSPYSFQAKSVLTLTSDGALQARIVDDKPC